MPAYGRYTFFAPVNVYSNYEIQAYDSLVLVTTGNSNKTITLPKANAHQGKLLIVTKVDSGTGHVIVQARQGDTIDGGSSIDLAIQGALCYILSFGNNKWFSNILQTTVPYFPENISVNSVQTPQITSSGNLIINPNGNVGIGTTAPGSRLTVSGGASYFGHLATPSGVSATATSGGTLSAGTYYYVVTALDSNNLSSAKSTEVSCTVDGSTTNACQISWSSVSGAAKYRVWRGTSSGGENRYFETTTTSYTDTGTTGTSGTPPSFPISAYFAGNVGIETTEPTNKLTVVGNIETTKGFKSRSHFMWSGRTGYFPNGAANQVAYIDFGDVVMWGWVEVTLTDAFSNQNTIGKYTKRYYIGRNAGSAIHSSSWEVPVAFGPVAIQWKLGDFEVDANNHLRIPIYHLTTTGNYISVFIEGEVFDDTGSKINTILNNLTLTTPITLVNSETRDYVSIMESNVGIGTTRPQQKLTLGSGSNFAVEMAVPSGVTASTSTGGTLNGTYYYKVSASDSVGWTILSSEVSATVDGGTTAGTINVSWSAVTGATKYRVWRGTSSGGENQYYETTATSISDDGSLTFTSGTPPSVTTAYVNKVTASGNSWFLGGNVGIGTTGPGYKLHVYDNTNDVGLVVHSTSDSKSAYLGVFNSGGSSGNYIQIRAYGGTTGSTCFGISTNKMNSIWSNYDSVFTLGTLRATPLVFGTNNLERMRIDSSGNVGIGTTAPSQKLTVAGNIGIQADADGFVGTLDNYALSLKTNNTDRVYITSTGNVGIGTTAPGYQLQLSQDSAAKPSTNTWTVVSDERLKKDVAEADLTRCYEIVKTVPLKYFHWREDIFTPEQIKDRGMLGWLASDVEPVFPKAVDIIPKFVGSVDIGEEIEEYEEQEYTVETVEREEKAIEIRDGKPVQVVRKVTEERRTPVFDYVEVVDEQGNVVYNEDGTPLTYPVPRMVKKTRTKKTRIEIENCKTVNSDQIMKALYGAVQLLIQKVEKLEAQLGK